MGLIQHAQSFTLIFIIITKAKVKIIAISSTVKADSLQKQSQTRKHLS